MQDARAIDPDALPKTSSHGLQLTRRRQSSVELADAPESTVVHTTGRVPPPLATSWFWTAAVVLRATWEELAKLMSKGALPPTSGTLSGTTSSKGEAAETLARGPRSTE